MKLFEKGQRGGWVLLASAFVAGCGPDPEVLAKQDEQIRQEYERQKKDPPWLSPKEKAIRRERLEMEFGDLAPNR